MHKAIRISPLALAALVMGCEMQDEGAVSRDAEGMRNVSYNGIDTRLLDNDLVQFHVTLGGEATRADVSAYAECAAAQYALIRGYGFARHVRTTVEKQNETLRGDAVYTVSPALPDGLKTIDAEVVVQNCSENGIPTV
ncbi:MAG: hypothetical protein CSA70_01635 [Rhodobacterales bacterium]|nr:MAG: hypothetical protein CSA70_01635 [Rhodobacterales bacterium]